VDSFINTAGPNAEEGCKMIVVDPYVAVKFFHFVIAALLEELLGIVTYNCGIPVKRTDRIFERVTSYIGTVEAQGRGTLHLHIVVWLCKSLTSSRMQHALQSDSFRLKIKEYIGANIQADIDGADKTMVKRMARENGLSYSRPCDPHQPNYHQTAKTVGKNLAKALQHHCCSKDTCLIVKKGGIRCKCRAPFEVSTHDYVNEDR